VTTVSRIRSALVSFWTYGQPVERTAYVVGSLLIVSGLGHLVILLATGASWDGPLSFRKAITFGLSFGLTLVTIAWVTSFLRMNNRRRARLLGAFTAACVLETTLVSLQVWRGVPSHFNLETTFDGLVARTLAAGGLALVGLVVAFTLIAFRRNHGVPLSLLIAIRIGFSILIGSMVVGATMIAKGMRLVFAGNPQAAYATGGTLKPTHAVAMHAVLVLPLLAWWLSFADWNERQRVTAVTVASIGYVVAAAMIGAENFGLGLRPALVLAGTLLGISAVIATSLVAFYTVMTAPDQGILRGRS